MKGVPEGLDVFRGEDEGAGEVAGVQSRAFGAVASSLSSLILIAPPQLRPLNNDIRKLAMRLSKQRGQLSNTISSITASRSGSSFGRTGTSMRSRVF